MGDDGQPNGGREPGEQYEPTLDEELLLWLGDESAEVRAADAARVHDIAGEFAAGFSALADVGPAVTVFGSARTPPEHPTYELVREVGAASGAPATRSSPAAGRA